MTYCPRCGDKTEWVLKPDGKPKTYLCNSCVALAKDRLRGPKDRFCVKCKTVIPPEVFNGRPFASKRRFCPYCANIEFMAVLLGRKDLMGTCPVCKNVYVKYNYSYGLISLANEKPTDGSKGHCDACRLLTTKLAKVKAKISALTHRHPERVVILYRCDCKIRGSTRHLHHPDYHKPYEVHELCRACHSTLHSTRAPYYPNRQLLKDYIQELEAVYLANK